MQIIGFGKFSWIYVDDINIVIDIIPKGWKWNVGEDGRCRLGWSRKREENDWPLVGTSTAGPGPHSKVTRDGNYDNDGS